MTTEELAEARIAFLNDTIRYYGEDTSRRAICEDTGSCMYRTPEGRKCAIGRHIPDGVWPKEGDAADSTEVFPYIPEHIQKLGGSFLNRVQDFHDRRDCWDKEGISNIGRNEVRRICGHYTIDFSKIIFP
jgi:hypothetical protein